MNPTTFLVRGMLGGQGEMESRIVSCMSNAQLSDPVSLTAGSWDDSEHNGVSSGMGISLSLSIYIYTFWREEGMSSLNIAAGAISGGLRVHYGSLTLFILAVQATCPASLTTPLETCWTPECMHQEIANG